MGDYKCICGKYIPLGTTIEEQNKHTGTKEHWENAYNILLVKYTTMADEYTQRISQLNIDIGALKSEIQNLEARIKKKRIPVK
jgi:uncharacterized small protein (DUF1192 family)